MMNALKKSAKSLVWKVSPKLNATLRMERYKSLNTKFPNVFNDEDAQKNALLQQVYDQGFAVLPSYFDAAWCEKCIAEFHDMKECHPSFVQSREDDRIFGCENVSETFARFHDDKFLQSIADQYYGETAKINVSLVNHVEPTKGSVLGSGGDWHRDRMIRQFKALVYLKDVTDENGPFQYIVGSNTHHHAQFKVDTAVTGMPQNATRLTDKDVQPLVDRDPSRLKTFTAPKGTVVLVDTSGIHRGMPIKDGERYAMFNYYIPASEYDSNYVHKKFAPVVPENFSMNKNDQDR